MNDAPFDNVEPVDALQAKDGSFRVKTIFGKSENFKTFFVGNKRFATCIFCKVVYDENPHDWICLVCGNNEVTLAAHDRLNI